LVIVFDETMANAALGREHPATELLATEVSEVIAAERAACRISIYA
jgi:hypothetical protein